MHNKKERIDKLLVDKEFFRTREKARAAIMSGIIFIGEQRIDKPGEMVNVDSDIIARHNEIPYVSRGGLKLKKAIDTFNLNLSDKIAADIGASTGGFTQCLLLHGAKKVYAIDVGYGQLAWELRNDERVVCMERTNARYITPQHVNDIIDIVTIDTSFISLKLILPAIQNILKDEGEIVCLVKPQFEAGKDEVGKKGVVRDATIHIQVITNIIDYALSNGLSVEGITFSPIKGPKGNIEFLLYLKRKASELNVEDYKQIINEVVMKSHKM